MKSVAIITARGGSKRIPRKNIKEFCGKPIIAYSIEAALKTELFDEVMVSTDNEEIAEVARHYGAKVPFMRSEATSGDYATTEDVLLEVLDQYRNMDKSFDMVCCILPTAPFVTVEKLRQAYELLKKEKSMNAIVPVVRFGYPPQRGMIIQGNCIQYKFPENALKRSQDLEPIFHDCGQFYYCRTEALRKYRDLICPNCLPFELSEKEVQDIDNTSDWQIAELKYQLMQKEERKNNVPNE